MMHRTMLTAANQPCQRFPTLPCGPVGTTPLMQSMPRWPSGLRIHHRADRPHMQVTNYILATALGNHCAKDLRYTNAFDCPAVCAYDPQRVNRPFCPVPGPAEVPALLAASNCTSRPPCKVPPTATEEQITDTYGELQFTGAQLRHTIPCEQACQALAREKAASSLSSAQHLDAEENLVRQVPESLRKRLRSAEWCDCCHLELDDAKLGDIPTVSIWLWCVAFTVIFLAWRSLLAKMQNGVSAAINRGSVTAADYAVLVSNVGGISNIKEVLVDYAAHYGEVLAAFPLLAVGDVLTQCDAVRRWCREAELTMQ